MTRHKPDTVILRLSIADAKALARSVQLAPTRSALDRHYDALTGAIRNAVNLASVADALNSARADAYDAWRDLDRSDECRAEVAEFRAMLGQLDALAAALGEGKDGTP